MFVKKLRKLYRNPKLFFYDALKNRIGEKEEVARTSKSDFRSSVVADEISLNKAISVKDEISLNSAISAKDTTVLNRNWMNSKHHLVHDLLSYLFERTCFVQQVHTDTTDSIRIAVKSNDFAYVLNHVQNFVVDGYRIELVNYNAKASPKEIVVGYFRDEESIYFSPKLEFDPWFISEKYKRIYTHNKNSVCTHLDIALLNKTVHASNPYFLQKEVEDVNDYHLSKALNLPPSAYDNCNFDVDVVFTWVDGGDPRWKSKRDEYRDQSKSNVEDVGAARYEQIDELRYSLRSVASYFKDCRKIFIVTDQQIPWWLDVESKKVIVVDHKDIFPDSSHLPVFNSHAIEANIHRIPGLSKKFIYLNDDVFLWNPVAKSDFFKANGISISRFESISNVHGAVSSHFPAWRNAALNGNAKLEEIYGVRGYSYHHHCPHALDKDVCENMWSVFEQDLTMTSKSKFRSINDVSPVSFLYHAYSFLNAHSVKEDSHDVGVFNTANSGHLDLLEKNLNNAKMKFVCINDGGQNRFANRVINILQKKFPIAAEWELKD